MNKRGDGVLLYVHSQFNFELVPDDLNVSDPNLEFLSLIVKMPKQRDFVISIVYLPPSGCKTDALDSISCNTNEIREIVKTNVSIVLGGDFNFNFDNSNE